MKVAKVYESQGSGMSHLRRVAWGESIPEALDACRLAIPEHKRREVERYDDTHFDADETHYHVVTENNDCFAIPVLQAIDSWHEIMVCGGHRMKDYQSDMLIDAANMVRTEGRPFLLGIRDMGTEFYSYDWWDEITDLKYVREKADAFGDIFWYRWDGKALLPITEADLGERIEVVLPDGERRHKPILGQLP